MQMKGAILVLNYKTNKEIENTAEYDLKMRSLGQTKLVIIGRCSVETYGGSQKLHEQGRLMELLLNGLQYIYVRTHACLREYTLHTCVAVAFPKAPFLLRHST